MKGETIGLSSRHTTVGDAPYWWRFYEELDRSRRWQGAMFDALGFGPLETPFRIAFRTPRVLLRAYHDSVDAAAPVVVIVPAPIKRPYIWDLAPSSSVVQRCRQAGLTVYMIEWTLPATGDRRLGLADYGERLILECLNAIKRRASAPIFLAAHSLGGTLAAIFAALHPGQVQGLVLIAAPLHFGPRVGVFGPLAAAVARVQLTGRIPDRVPGSFLSAISFLASPHTFGATRCADFARSLANPQALRTHLQVERWTLDEMPMPRQLFEEVVELLIRKDRFLRGTLEVAGRRVAPGCLRVPLLCVADGRCRIVPPNAVVPFFQATRSSLKTLLWYEGDIGVSLQHVGPLVGRSAHRHLWPAILRWVHRAARQTVRAGVTG